MKNQIISEKMKKTVAVLLAVFFSVAEILLLPVVGMRASLGGATARAQEYGPPDQYPDRDYPPSDREYGPPPDQAYSSREPGYPRRGPEYPPPPLLSPDQLENLLGPVALYPDPLLAQILVAATFADQVEDAARWMHAYNDPYGIDRQPWDVSVKAVAHYPSVLNMMSERIDWTTALGQAYVEQPDDVFAAVQHLRAMAQSSGYLASNNYWEVVPAGGFIEIFPIQPAYIFVPIYDPAVVFVAPAFFVGVFPVAVITFGPPLLIGAWLNLGFYWSSHRIYYHGWSGGGWIARSRSHVSLTSAYVGSRYSSVRVNRDITRRGVNYSNLNRFTNVHRDAHFNNLSRGGRTERGNTNAGTRSLSRGPSNPRTDTYRGRSTLDRGRPSFDQRGAPEDRSTQLRGRSQLAPSSPRDFRQPRSGSGANRSFDPRTTEHGPSVRDRSAEARGRSQFTPSPQKDLHQPRGGSGANRSFDPRSTEHGPSVRDRSALARGRSDFAPSSSRDFHQPRGGSGANRSFDPRSSSDNGSFGKSHEQQFAPSQHDRTQRTQTSRQERPNGSKHPEKGFGG